MHLYESEKRGVGLVTNRTDAYLSWRYGLEPLCYRTLRLDRDSSDLAVFRLRRRGSAVEATVAELFATSRRNRRRLVRAVAHLDEVDYAAAISRDAIGLGAIPLQRLGPILTARALDGFDVPPLSSWQLSLGDIELF